MSFGLRRRHMDSLLLSNSEVRRTMQAGDFAFFSMDSVKFMKATLFPVRKITGYGSSKISFSWKTIFRISEVLYHLRSSQVIEDIKIRPFGLPVANINRTVFVLSYGGIPTLATARKPTAGGKVGWWD